MWAPRNRPYLSNQLRFPLTSNGSKQTCISVITSLYGGQKAYEVTQALERIEPEPIGVATIEIDEKSNLWEVSAYFNSQPDSIAISLIEAIFSLKPFQVSQLPETDWVAKVNRDLVPVRAGNFWVYLNQDPDEAPAGTIPIRIASSMAFGTGHHGTTQGCLDMLERVAAEHPEFKSIADIGCGTGILSMAAFHLWGRKILASDIDEVAVEVTLENTSANQMENQIICTVAEGFNHSLHKEMAPFDLVIANILLKPLVSLAPDINRYLGKGGLAILSGIMLNQENALTTSYLEHGFQLKDKIIQEDWVTLLLSKG